MYRLYSEWFTDAESSHLFIYDTFRTFSYFLINFGSADTVASGIWSAARPLRRIFRGNENNNNIAEAGASSVRLIGVIA